MEYGILLFVVALIAYAIYDSKWKPRHQKCPSCGKTNFARYAVDTEYIDNEDMNAAIDPEGVGDWNTICEYYEKVNVTNPYKPVRVTTHFRCKDCGHEDVRITFSHDGDYEIGTGMHNVRWGKKVYAGKAHTRAINGLRDLKRRRF